MEIKINKEIKDYHESMFFGLSLRQSFFSILAVAVAIGIYFWIKPHFGIETVSWVCVLGAAPFAALGFIRYQGMNAEQLLIAWLKSEILEPKTLVCKTTTAYYEKYKETNRGRKLNDKNRKKKKSRRKN